MQTKIRYNKLHEMLVKYKAGTLPFKPRCSYDLLSEQAKHMGMYLHCLEIRAEVEKIGLENLYVRLRNGCGTMVDNDKVNKASALLKESNAKFVLGYVKSENESAGIVEGGYNEINECIVAVLAMAAQKAKSDGYSCAVISQMFVKNMLLALDMASEENANE